MQDNKILGDDLSTKSTVNATTDMSNEQRSFLPSNFKFEDPNAKAKDYTATLGDTAKAFGSGALRGIAGIGELAENTLGVGESLRDVANSGADFVEQSMTPEGRETLNARLFDENENGNAVFADGAGDIDVWAMKIANGLGSLVPNLAAGGGAGAAAKVALRGTIMRSMVKKGATEQAAAAVADKAIARVGGAGAMAAGVGSSLGSASMDAYNTVMQMDSSTLADQSPYFQSSLLRLADEPENEGLSATALFDKAKEETARYASSQMSTDPTAIAASVAGAMGDKFLFDALLGKMGKGIVSGAVKGAVSEGGTEFIEGYGQTVAQNQVLNEAAGTNVDPTSGALTNALEGMAVGVGTGGPLGAGGGALGRFRNRGEQTQATEDTATDPGQVDPTADAEPDAPVDGSEPVQGGVTDAAPVDAQQPVEGQAEPKTAEQLREEAAERQADDERRAARYSHFSKTRQNLLGALQRDGRPVNRSLAESTLTASQPDRDMIANARSVDSERVDQLLDTIATGTDAEAEGAYGELDVMASQGELSTGSAQNGIVNRAIERNRTAPTEEQRVAQRLNRYSDAGVIDNPRGARANLAISRLGDEAYQSARSLNTGPWGTRQEPEGWNERQELPTEAWQRRQDEQARAGLEQEQRDQDYEPARLQQQENDRRQEDIETRRSALGQTGNRLDQLSTAETNARGRRTPGQIEQLQRENKERELERTFFPQPLGQEGISKRLRRKLRRSKGFDSDAVLEEFQNNEQRLRAYAQDGRVLRGESLNDAVADLAARFNTPNEREQNNTRQKANEILERMQSRSATEFKQNLITQSIRRINQVIDRAPGETVEIDGQQVSKQEAKAQMAGSVRSLANKFISKTAALNERTRLRRAENTMEAVNDRQREERQGDLRYAYSDARNRSQAPRRGSQEESTESGLEQTAVTEVVPGVEHLGRDSDREEPQMSRMLSDGYEMIASGVDGFDDARYSDARNNPNDYVTTQTSRGPYALWRKPRSAQDSQPSQRSRQEKMLDEAQAVIRQVVQLNRDSSGKPRSKASLKGVREAYRKAGFTAKELEQAIKATTSFGGLNEFERYYKDNSDYRNEVAEAGKPEGEQQRGEKNTNSDSPELKLNQNDSGESGNGRERAGTSRPNERPSGQSEVQTDAGGTTNANRAIDGETDSRTDNDQNPGGDELSDGGERSVQGSPDERLSLDDVNDLSSKTTSQRIAANLAAIRLLKNLMRTGEPATLQQKQVLAQYSGWGGLGSVFDGTNASKSQIEAHQTLKAMLTDDEYNTVRGSVRNAHYTSESVVKAMWDGVKAFGLGDAPMNVLEPSIGSGNFIGWQPEGMRDNSTWFASELDSVTGNIAKLIYPEANINVAGFEETPFKTGVFSLAIGNPPFGSTPINDRKNPDLSGMNIHNYFIGKSAKLLHENGLMMQVITSRFLDTPNKNHRQLSNDLEFIGALRLPNNAFKANAATEVTTDIVVFRKLKAGEKAKNTIWTDTNGEVNGFRINKWFEQNPEFILGEVAQGKMYRGDETESTVNPTAEHANLQKSITDALDLLSRGQDLSLTPEIKDTMASQVMLSESDLAIDGMMLNDEGKVMRRGMDHPMNGAQVYEVTPDTIWSDEGMTFDHIRQLVNTGDKARLKQLIEQEVLSAASGKIKSEFRSSQVRESASKSAVAYLNGNGSKAQALSALDAAIDNTRLGKNPFRKLKGLLAIRNTALELIQAEKTSADNMEALRQRLNNQYNEFSKAFASKGKNGAPASISANMNVLAGDVGIESGLDSVSPTGEVTKSAIFERRMLFPYQRATSAGNVDDAVNYSMREHGAVNLEYISQLLGKDKAAVLEQLTTGDKPYLLMNPKTEQFEFIDDYLSGNVKAKYQDAKNAGLDTNIKLLESVLPEDKAPDQVKPSIRATWIDPEVFEGFAQALGFESKVHINRSLGSIRMSTSRGAPSPLGAQFRHDRATIADMFNSVANGKSLVIYDDAGKQRTKNEKATREVNALANKMASTFVNWARNDADAARRIADNFNERINTNVNRKYNGRLYLQPVGMNPTVDMRKTQLDGALRMIQSKNTLLDHTVGAGKTFTAITGMMERKRLGLSKKPMAAVPNHILGSFAKDITKLYPGAKILVADDKSFSAKKRKQFFSRIATGDYDVVLIGHSHLRAMPNDIETFRKVINEKIAELRRALEEARREAKDSGQRGSSVSQIEESITRLSNKIKDKEKALSENADKIGINFSDLGVDYLVVDEAHEFKNLTYATRSDRVVGMNDPKGSEKALDLLIKTRHIQGLDNGGVTFMTGTPISNSLVEVYTMMYYLGHDTLTEKNMSFYDAFAGGFFNTEITLEYTPTGTVKERSVLKGLNNMQQLSTLYRGFSDVITQADMVNIYRQDVEAKNKRTGQEQSTRFPIPNVKGGKRKIDVAPATEAQREYNDYLIARMEAFDGLKSKEDRLAYAKIDNPLWVLTDAKKASLDVRMVDPTSQRDPTGKIARAAENIKRQYDQWEADKGAQLVFSDMGTPVKYAISNVKSGLQSLAENVVGKAKAKQFVESRLQMNEGSAAYGDTLGDITDRIYALAETDQIDADRLEALEDNIRELAASTLTADMGFSVYDDLKAALVEKGIPEGEVAFIHDYNTTMKKEALFDLVRKGDVRVLIGSSMKMGAGTNVQSRLVALHHLDVPWRPSDMEQREGRIIRQGNELYERAAKAGNPDGFEVEITAYTTQGSSDPVMWQILERKAGAIEQFRNGELDEYVETSNSDADSYAEFKAASTGNPIYRLKLESDAQLLDLDSTYTAQASSKSSAQRILDTYQDKKAEAEVRLARFKKANITEFDPAEFTDVATQAAADYLSANDTYEAEQARYQDLDAKERKALGLKRPVKPKRPTINELDTDYSAELNRKIIKPALAAIDKKRDWSGKLELGKHLALNVEVQDMSSADTNNAPYVTVSLVDGNGRPLSSAPVSVASTTITGSQRLMSAMHLNTIATSLNDSQRTLTSALRDLETSVKEARQLSKLDLSALRSELTEAQARNQWLSVETSMADLKENIRRSETPNKFIDSEPKRRVKRSSFNPNSIQPKTLQYQGDNYHAFGVRMDYPGWEYSGVMPALNDGGEYVHLLTSHDGDADAPVVAGVVKQPSNTPAPEYDFIGEAKQRYNERQQQEATRDIESPEDAGEEPGSVLLSRSGSDAGRSGVKSGKIVSGITAKRSAISDIAQAALRSLGLKDFTVAFEVADTESDLPANLKQKIAGQDAQGEVYGLYDPEGNKVWLVADKHNYASEVEETIYHEVAGHIGLARLLAEAKGQPDLNTLAIMLGGRNGIRKFAQDNGINLDPYIDGTSAMNKDQANNILVHELVAHLAERKKFANPIQRLLAKIRRFFRDRMSFVWLPEFNNTELLDLVFRAKQKLSTPPPKDRMTSPGNDPLFLSRSREQTQGDDTQTRSNATMSVDAALNQKQSALVRKIKQALYSAPVVGQTLDAMGRNKYAMLTLRQMGEVAHVINKPLGNMIDGYQDEINSMVVTQNMLAEQAASIAQDMSDWAKANAKDADVLFSLAHEATLADVDPSEAFQSRQAELEESIAKQERILKEEGGVNSERGSKAFNTLKEERELLKQEPYRRQRHVELRPKFARLNKEQKARYRQMRDHYREQSDRMNKALEDNIIRAVQDAKIRKAMLAELRQRNERAAKGLYFPLSRHGDYWIDFADQDGERQFMMFETKGEMELAAEKLTRAGFEINSGMKAQANAVQKASLPFVADVIKLVDEAHISDPAKQSLGDEIYQMYLRTLPARSMRRNFIHRKGVAGFSQDAVRALAEQGFKQSRQQARLDHMDILDNHLDTIQKYVGELPNNVEADRVVEELNKRHEWVRNPARSGWAQKLTGLGFVWMLGATPAAALVNLSQNLQVALPILGSRHTFAAASKEMLQASGEFLKAATKKGPEGQGVLSRTLTGSEKEAMRRAIDQGVIDVTQAADLAGLAENPNAKYSGAWNKWMNRVGWMFHQAEVFNREVTFLAAYRLEKQKHGDHERALNQAIKDTWDSHFDYSSINRARFMQSDMAAVALQFKQYSQNMTYYLWSNLAKSVKGETPEVRRMAQKQLLGTLATTFFVGGAGALPLWALTTAINAAQGAFGDDDDPFDAETEMKAMLAGAFGKEWAATIWHGTLPSIGSRISLNDLWVRSINRDVDADDAYMEYMKQALGPVLGGIGVSWAQGMSDISNDNWARGIERFPPKAVRDMLKTARFINEEGVTTRTGAEVVSDLTYPELAGQMFGFAVGRANIQYDENNAIKNYEQHVNKRRQSLMNAYYTATRLKDGEAMREVMKKIARYNNSQYGRLNPITTKGLRQSIKTRQNNLAKSQNGIQVNPKLQSLVREYDFF
ncbi:PLxRFG domain-containing protein [Vibrio sp. ABG19]|uniref:PLxRFG domain-containing protein n=1 Tax=Vibrio sp. ABG19 TaxID=2817385 RepID=UPI00249DC6D9|nr:PLxRFG domain-containing protein [Vibrio sp. ABG19]WGY45220.1 PLxRFG domain-containing protein [Vibrio sp. ABG19]